MSRIWLGCLAAFGVAVGALLAGQLANAEEGIGRNPAAKNAVPAGAASVGQRYSAATERQAEPLTVLKTGAAHSRLIYRVKAGPAVELEKTIKQLFTLEGELHRSAGTAAKTAAGSQVAIASSNRSNSLVIAGPPDALEEVRTLLDKLDQPSGQILLEMEVGEAPVDEAKPADGPKPGGKPPAVTGTANAFRLAERPAKMETIGRIRLTTMDNQAAYVQMGARVPMVAGVTKSAAGEFRSASTVNVGLILGITPRVTPDGSVVMEIDAEQSQVGSENEGTPIAVTGEKVVRAPRIETTTVQSTVTIPDGQTVVLASVARQSKSDKALVIVLTPHILGPDKAKQAR